MKSRQQRLKAIELTLTPRQIVVVWLRNALQAATFEKGARRTPRPREAVANAVRNAVQNSMKGQSEPLIERAVLQARQEADLLYNLAVNANVEVLKSTVQRRRECLFLLGYLSAEMRGLRKSAEMRGLRKKDRVQTLRKAVLLFLESVIVLDAAIAQVSAERLNGQPMLFQDCSVRLEEQLHMARQVSEFFNRLACTADCTAIDLEELRNTLRSETDHQLSIWVQGARMDMLSVLGQTEELHSAMDQYLLLFEPGGANNAAGA